jgi:cytoskeletal protein CcmA (bactofilin family)
MSLWQKNESERGMSNPMAEAPAPSRPQTTPPVRENRSDRLVNIGQSIEIRGELTGNEDLTIDGRIEGKIVLKDHNLTIGTNGRITAEIHAKSVVVNGEVVGDIIADDKIEIAPSGSVQGDLCAPRVALADGSSFKGSIDMGRAKTTATTQAPSAQRSNPKELSLAAKA